MSQKALFDPGFSKHLSSFQLNIESFYQSLSRISNFKQKKYQFNLAFPRIISLLNKHIGFYAGCMLWGMYLKSMGQEKIEDNPFLNIDYNEENSVNEPVYILNFIKNFDRDTKYYMNKPFSIDEKYINVLNKYIEFVKSNKGFSKTDTTDKIILPSSLENTEKFEIEKVEKEIQNIIQTGNIENLLDFCDKI